MLLFSRGPDRELMVHGAPLCVGDTPRGIVFAISVYSEERLNHSLVAETRFVSRERSAAASMISALY